MTTTYTKGQNLKLTFKDRMEDPTTWEAKTQVDLEEVTGDDIQNYYENSILVGIEVVNEDYSEAPLSKTTKVYK